MQISFDWRSFNTTLNLVVLVDILKVDAQHYETVFNCYPKMYVNDRKHVFGLGKCFLPMNGDAGTP